MEKKTVFLEDSDKYSLSGRVFHQLREEILSGKYKENEELRELSLATELGVSRTPVREALRQLELEGLVNILPNKGAYVTGISPKDIQDIYTLRSILEGLCARWATEYIKPEQMEKLEEIVFLSDFHVKQGHYEKVYELDGQFHTMLYEASNSKMLKHVLSDFHKYVQRVRKGSISNEKRAAACAREHAQIVEAMKEGNAEKAELLANAHILNTVTNIREQGLEKLLDMEK